MGNPTRFDGLSPEVIMLEKAVFVRHGDYEDGVLTAIGVAVVHARAIKVAAAFAGASPILLLSSPVKRAMQTAEILAKALKIEQIHQHHELEEEYRDGLLPGLDETLAFFQRVTADAKYVLVSTHKPVAMYLPGWYAKQVLGVELEGMSCEKGEACLLDAVAKTLTQV